ncbi:hypothetical protein AB0H58_10150 [Nocardia neocaledoniensis]|uniref:hypothetical protein n=1 Tax=Nocardia neocaledoniensis TaxID=236511 RepID=UPI0033C2C558
MYRDLDPRITEPTELDTAPVSWPDPSPLQAWWNDIMGGADPATRPRPPGPGGQRAPRLPAA